MAAYLWGLRSILIILYIVCFGCYVLFTRQPDYFDSEKSVGTFTEQNAKPVVQFSYGNGFYHATVPYKFLYMKGEQAKVIFETADPSNARLYSIIGYWITFGELIASIVIVLVLYFVAVSITSNPTPEALIEEREMGKKKLRKPRYD